MNFAKDTIEEIKRIKRAMSDFEMLDNEIQRYNTADGPNMTPNEMNEFRHIAASASLIAMGHPNSIVEIFGYFKEIKDFVRDFERFYNRFKVDSLFDIRNNKKGIEIGNKFRYMRRDSLYKYIFKTEIEPKRKNNYQR